VANIYIVKEEILGVESRRIEKAVWLLPADSRIGQNARFGLFINRDTYGSGVHPSRHAYTRAKLRAIIERAIVAGLTKWSKLGFLDIQIGV
jgi:hypothetical protein